MADILDKLIALNKAYDILSGASEVVGSTKLVLESAEAVNDTARDVRKGGKSASVDYRKLEKTLGADGKELARLNRPDDPAGMVPTGQPSRKGNTTMTTTKSQTPITLTAAELQTVGGGAGIQVPIKVKHNL